MVGKLREDIYGCGLKLKDLVEYHPVDTIFIDQIQYEKHKVVNLCINVAAKETILIRHLYVY